MQNPREELNLEFSPGDKGSLLATLLGQQLLQMIPRHEMTASHLQEAVRYLSPLLETGDFIPRTVERTMLTDPDALRTHLLQAAKSQNFSAMLKILSTYEENNVDVAQAMTAVSGPQKAALDYMFKHHVSTFKLLWPSDAFQ